jgi:hypothetical protein
MEFVNETLERATETLQSNNEWLFLLVLRAYIAKYKSDFPHDGYTLLEERNRLSRLIRRAKDVFN